MGFRIADSALVGIAALAWATPSCLAQCLYEAEVIASAPLPWPYDGLWNAVTPYSMNVCHTVVGTVASHLDDTIDLQGFIWHPGDQYVTPIEPPLGARWTKFADVNDLNQVVGEFRVGNPDFKYAFIQNLDTGDLTVIPPPLPPNRGYYAVATGINNQGQVVGYWGNTWIGNPVSAAFLWQNGVFQDLTPILQTTESQALAINEMGVIAGWLTNAEGDMSAFRYEITTRALTTFGPIATGTSSWANCINSAGSVIAGAGDGLARQPAGWPRAMQASDGTRVDLGSLQGKPLSSALVVDALGRVGGTSWAIGGGPSSVPHAFLWQAGSMFDFNDQMPFLPLLSIAKSIVDLKDDGSILGGGVWYGGLAGIALRGFLAHPAGFPHGDVNLDCAVNVTDISLVTQYWGTTSTIGDADKNGFVDGADLGWILANWSQ